jgi:hypothetical protein
VRSAFDGARGQSGQAGSGVQEASRQMEAITRLTM